MTPVAGVAGHGLESRMNSLVVVAAIRWFISNAVKAAPRPGEETRAVSSEAPFVKYRN